MRRLGRGGRKAWDSGKAGGAGGDDRNAVERRPSVSATADSGDALDDRVHRPRVSHRIVDPFAGDDLDQSRDGLRLGAFLRRPSGEGTSVRDGVGGSGGETIATGLVSGAMKDAPADFGFDLVPITRRRDRVGFDRAAARLHEGVAPIIFYEIIGLGDNARCSLPQTLVDHPDERKHLRRRPPDGEPLAVANLHRLSSGERSVAVLAAKITYGASSGQYGFTRRNSKSDGVAPCAEGLRPAGKTRR